jgi:hypothetical protein
MDADGWGRSQVANGQYMLFRREAYTLCGGHEAVRDSIIEDVALAREARRKGVSVGLLRGEGHVDVRMYGGLRSLWEGLSKNAVRFVAVKPLTGSLTALAGLTLASALPAAIRAPSWARKIATLTLPVAALLPWYRRFAAPWHVLLYPLAAAVFQMLALDSTRRTLRPGHTRWKGRSY